MENVDILTDGVRTFGIGIYDNVLGIYDYTQDDILVTYDNGKTVTGGYITLRQSFKITDTHGRSISNTRVNVNINDNIYEGKTNYKGILDIVINTIEPTDNVIDLITSIDVKTEYAKLIVSPLTEKEERYY